MYASGRLVDYLLIGHISKDIAPDGPCLGGTAAYSSLTARALGRRVGLVTSAGPDLDLQPLSEISIHVVPAQDSTSFVNEYLPTGRRQSISATAVSLSSTDIPGDWLNAPIIPVAPIADEVAPSVIDTFPKALVCLTPQGWLRRGDSSGNVRLESWEIIQDQIERADAVVFSLEDLQGSQEAIDQISRVCKVLVITEGSHGARVFWGDEWRQIPATLVKENDSTGAGDIFAPAFFVCLSDGISPWNAAKFANHLAAASVTRTGIASVPSSPEIKLAERMVFE